ncbi:MAG: M81 family metallopeptidase [Nitriliruptoraceae bacterium]
MRKVLVGAIRHELNSFIEGTIRLDTFHRLGLQRGDEMFSQTEGESLSGAMGVAADRDITLIPTINAFAGAGPLVEEDVYAPMAQEILDGARTHRDELDGVYLPLHGAMVTTQRDDPEGDLIHDVRAIVGPDVPIAVSLDLHTHMTDRMVSGADILIGYRTCPHTDIFETGVRAMHLLADAIDSATRPVAAHRKIRLMASAEAHDTTFGPLTVMQARARELEQQPGVLSVSILATQPWMDVPDLGWSATVIADGDLALAQRTADTLAQELWDARETYHVVKTPLDEAIGVASTIAREKPGSGPVVVADGADSPSAGSSGDGTALLAYILEHKVDLDTLLIVTDPAVPGLAAEAGEGATIDIDLGGRLSPRFFSPLRVTGAEVVTVTQGPYRSLYPSTMIDPGRTAVLKVRNTRVVVTEHPVFQLDLEPYRRLGLEPASAELVQAKSAGGFRAYFSPIASEVLDLDTVGPCDSNLTRLPFERITRPLWPFDPDLDEPWH